MSKIIGNKIASVGENVQVELDEDAVASVANALSTTLLLQGSTNLTDLISEDELEDCFNYAIKVVLQQDAGAKPSFETVPNFLSDVTMSLNGIYRGVRIEVSLSSDVKRPNSYPKFLNILQSMGIPVGKPLRVDPNSATGVMKVGITQLQGMDWLVGIEDSATIEEMVVRAMLTVQQDEQEKLQRILGQYEYMYVSKEELLRQWACSLPVGKRG